MIGKRLRYFVKPMTGERISFLTKQIFVFKDGRLFDNFRKRFIKQYEIQGYLCASLRDDNGKWHSRVMVHNLVATCFIRPLEKGDNVHHINHVRSDNRLENLQIINGGEHSRKHVLENWQNGTFDGLAAKVKKAWADGKMDGVGEKIRKAWADGKMDGNGEKLKKAWKDGKYDGVSKKLRNVGTSIHAKQVAQLDMDCRLVKIWPSTRECHRNGFSQGNVSSCCRGCFNRPGNNIYKNFKWMWLEEFQRAQQESAIF